MTSIVIVLVAGVCAVVAYRRHTARCREAMVALRRLVRVRVGVYDLRELVAAAVGAIEACSLPSITTTYLPNRVVVGLHPVDADRFAGLLGEIAAEIAEIVAERARRRAGVTLLGGAVEVTVMRDPSAAPGRPVVGARLARPASTVVLDPR